MRVECRCSMCPSYPGEGDARGGGGGNSGGGGEDSNAVLPGS